MRRILVALGLVAWAVFIPLSSVPAHAAGAPTITAAVALDQNGDDHVDGIQLTYSTKVVHALDKDHSYPFSVAGYKITKVGKAKGTSLTISLKQLAAKDIEATPSVSYAPTGSDPVTSKSGVQAAAQTFTGTQSLDPDGDGYTVADGDCAPFDPTIHPGAVDLPDMGFVDSNCDGIDGDAAASVFVSPLGDDSNPGTESQPVASLERGIALAALTVPIRPVLLAARTYDPIALTSTTYDGLGIYGGYSPSDWSRSLSNVTTIGGGFGVFPALDVDGAIHLDLQLVDLDGGEGTSFDGNSYGLFAVDGADVTLEQVTISAPPALGGTNGNAGGAGQAGANGGNAAGTLGGAGGFTSGWAGGAGGNAGTGAGAGVNGTPGSGPSGGAGGTGGAGTVGAHGTVGGNGSPGPAGANAPGGASTLNAGDGGWVGWGGASGTNGTSGSGGGGGGGGGGLIDPERCTAPGHTCSGGGGGGGGEGGLLGQAGAGGSAGGGSIGVYLWDSFVTFVNPSVSSCVITTGNGGAGGAGGTGGAGGAGGTGGTGATAIGGAGGHGGNGGAGGSGGNGGGGEGGPSIGIFVGTGATMTPAVPDCSITIGTSGAGGAPNGGIAPSGEIVHY